MSEFESKVVAFALNELSLAEFEAWVYENNDQLENELDPETFLAVLSANYQSNESVVGALNAWFRNRFPSAFADSDLRSLRGSHMSPRFKQYVLKSLS